MLIDIRVFNRTVVFCEPRALIQKIHSIVEAVWGSYDVTGCVILVFICESITEHKHDPNVSFRGYKSRNRSRLAAIFKRKIKIGGKFYLWRWDIITVEDGSTLRTCEYAVGLAWIYGFFRVLLHGKN